MELLGAMALDSPHEIQPHHVFRRIDDLRVRNLAELYDFLEPGQLLNEKDVPEGMRDEWQSARADCWTVQPEAGQHGGDVLREDGADPGP